MKFKLTASAMAVAFAMVSSQALANGAPAPAVLDGAYADLDDQIDDAEAGILETNDAIEAAQEGLSDAQEALNDFVVELDADEGGYVSPVDVEATGAAAFNADVEAYLAAQELAELEAALAAAEEGSNAAILAEQEIADFLELNEELLAGRELSDFLSAPGVFTEGYARIGDFLGLQGAVEAAGIVLNGNPETEEPGLLATLAGQQSALGGLQRSSTILADAAASGNTNIALASGALTGDEAAVNSNYETEVLGALVNHEDRLVTAEGNIEVLFDNDEKLLAGITANAAALVGERSERIAADTELSNRLTSETNARIAADNALGARIDGVSGRVSLLETRVKKLDRKISSSTATAIALGGAAFLPDMKFNLAANVATYDGAQAISATLGAMVSPNVAVTAGIAGGINKGGKVGGRVGVIFGW